MKHLTCIPILLLAIVHLSCAQPYPGGNWKKTTQTGKTINKNNQVVILPGAFNTGKYFTLLTGKRVGLFANHTATIGSKHLVDSLTGAGIKVTKIFGPEHGFRGTADAGEKVESYIDKQTGIPVVSLYGKKRKPSAADLADVDVMVFDIQDVGVRFYTFISSLQDFIESAIEHNKPLIVLDRPNPNGFYVDGPILDTAFKSFIGMQPIPIVYGMTIGEYAQMLLGEKWLSPQANAKAAITLANANSGGFTLTVIPCTNYVHTSKYQLPQIPSPNLKQMQSIYLYSSTCFFEGTVLSEGRGTDQPFQVFGHPVYPTTMYAFTPKPNDGAKSSKCFYQQCYGWNLGGTVNEVLQKVEGQIQLKYLLEAYRLFPGKDTFFLKNNFFNKLAGNSVLMTQVKQGLSETDIRQSWQPGLLRFKAIRKKYLLYKDF